MLVNVHACLIMLNIYTEMSPMFPPSLLIVFFELSIRFSERTKDNHRLTAIFPNATLSEAPDMRCISVAHRYYLLPQEIKNLLLFATTRIYEFKLPDHRPFQVLYYIFIQNR